MIFLAALGQTDNPNAELWISLGPVYLDNTPAKKGSYRTPDGIWLVSTINKEQYFNFYIPYADLTLTISSTEDLVGYNADINWVEEQTSLHFFTSSQFAHALKSSEN